MALCVRPVQPGDEVAIAAIYNHYILHTVVTFEEQAVSPQTMAERIAAYTAHHPWLVCEQDGELVGYAYAGKYHARAAFRHTVETSVYVKDGCARRGIGRALYAALLPQLAQRGCHAVIAAIVLPHAGSVALHEAFGFAQVGQLREVGWKFGRWLDVGYWQKILC
jgi:phosphinothricin acetyltransferase